MDIRARIIAGQMTGEMIVSVAVGRLDYIGNFIPFGMVDTAARVVFENNQWTVHAKTKIPYQHESPRIITHVAMLILDSWRIDELVPSEVRIMAPGDVADIHMWHPLQEVAE